MATGLTNLAGNLFRGDDEVDRILGLPITQARLELKHHYQDKEFTEEQFNSFLDKLAKSEDLGTQIDIAKKAVTARSVDNELDIELNTPGKQLLWAAVFTRMMQTGKEPVSRSPLWNQMQGTIGFNNEEIGVARIINRSLQNAETVFEWGQPGSWFYYNPKTNKINLDMYYTLMMGFEHTRAVTLHEIGHSELSNTYSKRMKELYEKVKILIDPSTIVRDDKDAKKKQPRIKMKKAEYRQLMLDVAEWQLRFKLWHMTEDTVVNQFSSNMRHVLNQHFGKSLNHVSAVLQGFGEIVNGDDATRDVHISTNKPPAADSPERQVWEDRQKEKQEKANARRDKIINSEKTPLTDEQLDEIKTGKISKATAVKMFEQMNTAVLLAFYEQNGLFRGSDKNWERLRIIPEDIRKAVDVSKVPGAAGKDAFEYLVDLSVGKNNPDAEIMKMPMERARALRFLEERAVTQGKLNPELMDLPTDRNQLLRHLREISGQKAAASAFADLSSAFDEPEAKSPEQNMADAARRIVAHPATLGAKVAQVNDPIEALLNEINRIPAIRADMARDILARPGVIGADAAAKVEDPIEELFMQAAGTHGIRNLQPIPSDRLLVNPPYKTLEDSYRAVVAFTSEYRGKVMERIWDTYLAPYAEVILQEREKKIDKELEQKKEDQKQQKKDKQQGGKPDPNQKGGGGGGGEGEDQGEPQPGESGEDNQHDGGDSSPDIDDDEDGDGSDKKQQDSNIEIEDEEDPNGGKGDPSDDEDVELDDDDLKDIGDLSKDPKEGREQESQEGAGKDKDAANDKDGKEGAGWEQDDKPPEQRKPKKVGDLKDKEPANENLTDDQKKALKEAAEKQREEAQGKQFDDGGPSTDIDLASLAKGSWRDFNQRVQELSPVINQKKRIYQRILAQQRQQLRKQSTEKFSFFPKDGNLRGRYDRNKALRTKFKQQTGQLTVEDLKKVRDDDQHFVDSSVESMSLIDGSASMPDKKLGNGVTAMEVALQSAVIDYMAARKAGVGGYIVMWGNDKPYVIATPDTPLQEVGERLEGVRNGIKSETKLAPALISSVETLGSFVTEKSTVSGSSHIMIYSDGDIQDFALAVSKLTKLTESAKNLTVDVAVLVPKGTSPNDKTEMEKAFQSVIDKSPSRQVGIVRGDDARTVPLEISRLTLRRLRSVHVSLEPDKQKRARLKRLAQKLKDK